MEGLPISSPQPTTFEGLEKSLLPDTKLLPTIDLKTKNIAQKNFETIKKDYEELQQKPLDQAQIKLAKNWEKSAKADVDNLKPSQVLFGAIQKTLVDESTSLLAKITQNKGRWENPSFLRKIFYNIDENKQKALDKLSTKTTDLSERIKNFNTKVEELNTTASKTANKIGASWTNCTRQIDLYGQARDKQLETSRFLKFTKSRLNDYSSETQKSLSPKLRQLEALEQRLGQLKTARAENKLELNNEKVFKRQKDEIERLSTMLQTLTSEIQTTLETSPKKTLSEKISGAFTSVFSRSTVAAKKETLLLALKALPQEKASGPAPASGVEQGRTAIFGRRSSSPPKDASDIIKETVKNSPQAVVAALEVLVARCEVAPSNRVAKQELLSLLHAIQMHAIETEEKTPRIFKENPLLRNRIAAANLYELELTDKSFLTQANNEKGDKITLSMKLSHIDNNIWLWQCESELTQLAAKQLEQTATELATPKSVSDVITDLPIKQKEEFFKLSQELKTTEQTFLEGLRTYRDLASELLGEKSTPESVKAVCQDVVNAIGKSPNSFVDQSPLLEGSAKLEGVEFCQKLLENISGPKMQSQMAQIGDLAKTKFTTKNPTIIKEYLEHMGREDEASKVFSWAILGAQRNPRYELLLGAMQKQTTLGTQLNNNIGSLLEILKFKISITNRGIT